MRIIQNLLEIPAEAGILPKIGITIGNFDGVHLGHRELLKKIKAECQSNSQKFVVVTFLPHPQKILNPEKEHFLISSYEKRRVLLSELGVDFLVEMKFTRDFSTLPPDEFIQNFLVCYPNVKKFYLGYDFAFGANKTGGHDLVRAACGPKGIDVEIQPVFEFQGQIVSSTYIRNCLLNGEVNQVSTYLGRNFELEGVVIKGEGRGKKIGYPTANVQVPTDLIIPGKGVYVTRTIYRGMTYQSVTNIGNNPTFKDTEHLHIETNLFDFDTDIYGENLQIHFLQKLRDERKFPTVNDLINQIKTDVLEARKALRLS